MSAPPPHPLLARMRGDLPTALWPPVFSNKLAALAALVFELDRTQWLGGEEIAAGQSRQLARLARHFAAHSPHFRERLAKAGVGADQLDVARLAELAPLTRREVQAAGEALNCPLPPAHRPIRFGQTSGSTGEPVRIAKGTMCDLLWLAMSVRWHLWQEPDPMARRAVVRVLVTRGRLERADWGGGMAALFDTGPLIVLSGELDLAEQAKHHAEFAPQSLLVYPSTLAGLIDTMSPWSGLERIRTIGETLFPSLRTAAEAHFGVPAKDCYSSEEAGYIAVECPESGLYHVMSEGLVVEVVDEQARPCRPGETGRVLVTDLHNYAMPMIRYEIGDHAEVGGPCRCGRGLPMLARILGRERNLVMKPDGTTAWPVTGYRRFREIAPVAQFQFVQKSLEEIEVRLVVEPPLDATQEAALTALIQESLGYPFRLTFAYFERRLPRGANGKFEEFVRAF
jgi:phenylacetate-CoA ligase